jgi:hypothetical protein
MRSQTPRRPKRNAKERTTMARIDKQAAQEELKKASHLRAKAGELVEIASELEQEAARHEHDALDLTAPDKTSPFSADHSG